MSAKERRSLSAGDEVEATGTTKGVEATVVAALDEKQRVSLEAADFESLGHPDHVHSMRYRHRRWAHGRIRAREDACTAAHPSTSSGVNVERVSPVSAITATDRFSADPAITGAVAVGAITAAFDAGEIAGASAAGEYTEASKALSMN
jgi:hypothetical protein